MLLSCFDLLQFQGNIPIQMILIKINENYKFWKFDISYDTFGGIMFFRDNMYKKDSITDEQEKQLIYYADFMVQYLYAKKQFAKRASEKKREIVEQAHKEMISFMSHIKDIKMTLKESNIYLLIAAAKRKLNKALKIFAKVYKIFYTKNSKGSIFLEVIL